MNQRRGAYTPQFRQQMVELVGIGRKPIELAKEFGCHESSISAWVRQWVADAPNEISITSASLSPVKFKVEIAGAWSRDT